MGYLNGTKSLTQTGLSNTVVYWFMRPEVQVA